MKARIKEFVGVRLRPDQLKKIEAQVAKNPESTVSSIIRQALDFFLK